MSTNNIKFNVKNGLAVGASGFPVINTNGEWVGTDQSPYGATGVRGETGATGATGYGGATGITGLDGATGADGQLGHTGDTGQTGLDGASGIHGATGVDGDQGDLGDQGSNGEQGPDGVRGPDGVQGVEGPQGDQGINGDIGYAGATGSEGQVGATGIAGARYHATSTTTLNLTTGATGAVLIEDQLKYSAGQTILLADGGGKHIHATVTSYDSNTKILAFTPLDHVGTGSSSSWEINLDGAEGPAGATGVTGQDGATGSEGHDGYQGVIGATGTTGDAGEQGVDGHIGTMGASGATGIQGEQGPEGDQGVTGATGHDGVIGLDGPQGDQGISGDQGYQGADGATGLTGATGAQGGDGSGSGASVTAYQPGNWSANALAWVGSALTVSGSAHLEFSSTDAIYSELAGVSVGSSITINIITGKTTYNGTVTVTEAISTGDIVTTVVGNTHKIKISGSPNGNTNASIFSSTAGDFITYTSGASGATNTGYTGSTGATGPQGPEGNAGYNADQLTTGNPRGAWDAFTEYFVGDIVVTAAPADSHRCIVQNTGNDPDTTSGYWVYTAWAGASGASGIDGASGPTGETGTDGASGVTGASGPTGETGTDGASGPTGQTGVDGASGWTGYNGATGVQAAVGITGDTGDYGATGSHGLQFKATAQGNFSISAVGTSQLAVPFQADPETGNTFYNYSVGQSVVMAYDINNYMVGDITATDGTYIDFIVTKSVGTVTGVSGWIINLDGAVGDIGSDGATGAEGSQGVQGATGTTGELGAIKLQHGYEWTSGQLVWNGNAYAGGVSPSVSRLEFLQTDAIYSYLSNVSASTSLVIDWTGSGLVNVATVTTIGIVQPPTAYTNGRHYLQVSANPDGYASGGYASTDSTDIVMIGTGPRNQGIRGVVGATGTVGGIGDTGVLGDTGVEGDQGVLGETGYDGATGVIGATGPQGDLGASGIDGATGTYGLVLGSTGLSGTGQATVDIFAANEVGTAKYLVQAVDSSTRVQATEVIITQNAGGVYMTEYATLRTGATGYNVMDVTATTNGSVVSLKVTPATAGTAISWTRESVMGRIGGTTVHDINGSHVFYSRTNTDNNAIPVGLAYVYLDTYWSNAINFASMIGNSITFDDAGVGPQNPAIGTISSWDGATLIINITSGNFTSRNYLDKITYGY